jgi:hypothetical protein
VPEDEHRSRNQERPVVISAAAAPPPVARAVELEAGTALGPLPEARLEITPEGWPTVTALLKAQIHAAQMEREHEREVALRAQAERDAERTPTGKPADYERDLWERGRAGPERGRER